MTIYDLSIRDMKFINCAADEAIKSPVLMRHGAIAVAHGKIMARGYNHYRCNSEINLLIILVLVMQK